VKELGPSHRLLLNKFNLYQQHLLVVTREFEPQSNPLTRDDFKHAILTFRAVKGFYFYNSGPKAGASQTHKHIQVFPNEAKDLPMFRSILEYCRDLKYEQLQRDEHNPEELAVHQFPPFNFKHGFVLVGNTQ
jgi:sulfate adenylyltransferase (ADP) / ATP adenylyltransferase